MPDKNRRQQRGACSRQQSGPCSRWGKQLSSQPPPIHIMNTNAQPTCDANLELAHAVLTSCPGQQPMLSPIRGARWPHGVLLFHFAIDVQLEHMLFFVAVSLPSFGGSSPSSQTCAQGHIMALY